MRRDPSLHHGRGQSPNGLYNPLPGPETRLALCRSFVLIVLFSSFFCPSSLRCHSISSPRRRHEHVMYVYIRKASAPCCGPRPVMCCRFRTMVCCACMYILSIGVFWTIVGLTRDRLVGFQFRGISPVGELRFDVLELRDFAEERGVMGVVVPLEHIIGISTCALTSLRLMGMHDQFLSAYPAFLQLLQTLRYGIQPARENAYRVRLDLPLLK